MSEQVVARDEGLEEMNRAASRRLYEEVFGQGKYEVADELMSADMINHGPGSPPLIGTEQIKGQAALLRGAFPDFKVILRDQFSAVDRVCSRWSGMGTHTAELQLPTGPLAPTGNRIAFDEIRIDRYSDGKIVESWFIPDRFSLFQALGVIPRPPTS